MTAIGIGNGNWRAGEIKKLADGIKADAQNPGYVHPRDAKLQKLAALMGPQAFSEWYEKNRFTRPNARWEKLIDSKLAAETERVDKIEAEEERAYFAEREYLYNFAMGR